MTVDNFNWFLQTMFIYHTKCVIEQQNKKAARRLEKEGRDKDEDENNENEDANDGDNDILN